MEFVMASGAEEDTIRISEVRVEAWQKSSTYRTSSPVQRLTSAQLQHMPVLQVSDALKYLSGVQVKDYGGMGGMKTLSVRGLSATHTAVAYDGIPMANSQSGQMDLSLFSLEDLEQVSLYTGQSDRIFQPARMFASAAVLQLQSAPPHFEEGKKSDAYAGLKLGSFGLWNPSLSFAYRLSPTQSIRLSANYMHSEGDYPYTLHYAEGGLSSKEKRRNGAVENLRLEALWHWRKTSGEASFKAYYYRSERGLPGATVFYNSSRYLAQGLEDDLYFWQGTYKNYFNDAWAIQAYAKWSGQKTCYSDSSYLNRFGKDESRYHQQEAYLSVGMQYRPSGFCSFSLSMDETLQCLHSPTEKSFAEPLRSYWQVVAAGKYEREACLLIANVLMTKIDESVRKGKAGEDYFKLSPYVSLRYRPFEKPSLYVRAFYKHIFRMPSFNDLYYGRIGNIKLRPETTRQYNLGISLDQSCSNHHFGLTADAYYNRVKDKIVAYPTQNIFVWTMLNLGEASIKGVDVQAEWIWHPDKNSGLGLSGSYTWQSALNTTHPSDKNYLHQLPYTPRHSASGRLLMQSSAWSFSYGFIYTGVRYSGMENRAVNRMAAYSDHSMSIQRMWSFGSNYQLSLGIEMLNIYNQSYEVVRYYPMPEQSFRCKIRLDW